jgi:hypothetical protein
MVALAEHSSRMGSRKRLLLGHEALPGDVTGASQSADFSCCWFSPLVLNKTMYTALNSDLYYGESNTLTSTTRNFYVLNVAKALAQAVSPVG